MHLAREVRCISDYTYYEDARLRRCGGGVVFCFYGWAKMTLAILATQHFSGMKSISFTILFTNFLNLFMSDRHFGTLSLVI